MSSKPTLQQGHGDGLCGLYSLANFLMHFGNGIARDDCFKTIVEIADRLRLFSAWKVLDGYYDFELEEIFNFYAKNWVAPYRSGLLARARRESGESGLAFINRVVDAGGAVILKRNNGQHWALAFALQDGEVVAADSDCAAGRVIVRKLTDAEDGLVIVPPHLFDDFIDRDL